MKIGGIGDFTDLKRLVEIAANLQASVIGLNPLHTMFLDQPDQVNLPAATDEHPNWRRKQPLSLEEIATSSRIRAIADIMSGARPA